MNLTETDPQIAQLIRHEEHRQASTLELIASENHVSKAVMEAAGSVLTNKYAEGYPGARYYGGCGYYDEIENVLAKLGFGSVDGMGRLDETAPFDFTLVDGSESLGDEYEDFEDFVSDPANLAQYDIIFINCGQYEQTFFTNPTFVNNLRTYVDAGGSLYASDWAYDFVEVAFPESVDFEGNDAQTNSAAVGESGPMTAQVSDPALATALGGSTVSLNYDLPQWVVPTSAAGNARVLVTGNASAFNYQTFQTYNVPNAPLAVQFHFGQNGGSVIYTSFHNEQQSTQDMDLILSYMVFEL